MFVSSPPRGAEAIYATNAEQGLMGYFFAIDGDGDATYMSTLRRDNPWTQRWDDFIVGDFQSGDHLDDCWKITMPAMATGPVAPPTATAP